MPKGALGALAEQDIPRATRLRFARRVADIDGAMNDCWLWPLSTTKTGYGQLGWQVSGRRSHVLAHRVAYALYCGPIPDGMTVDHLCRTRACVNPAHLRLLTNAANARDNGMAHRTHCPQGHPYSGANLYVSPKGHRFCRACHRVTNANWYRKRTVA